MGGCGYDDEWGGLIVLPTLILYNEIDSKTANLLLRSVFVVLEISLKFSGWFYLWR